MPLWGVAISAAVTACNPANPALDDEKGLFCQKA
jgi:hypothetical protein